MRFRKRTLGPAALMLVVMALIQAGGPIARSAVPVAVDPDRAKVVVPSPEASTAPSPRAAMPATIVLASVAGRVEVAAAGTDAWKPAAEGASLLPEDQVKTYDDGYARVDYTDASLRLMPATLAILGHASIRLKNGSTWMRMNKSGGTFEIETPSVAVSVCGTLVRAEAGRFSSTIQLIHGCVDLKTSKQRERLAPMTQAVAAGGLLRITKLDAAATQRLDGEYKNMMKLLPVRGPDGKIITPGGGGSGPGSFDAGEPLRAAPVDGGGAPAPAQKGGDKRSSGGKGSGSKSSSRAASTRSGGAGSRPSLSNLGAMMDSRSTGLAAPAATGGGGGGSGSTPNSGATAVTVQSQPGGPSSRAAPGLIPAGVQPAGVGAGGAAPPPPPR